MLRLIILGGKVGRAEHQFRYTQVSYVALCLGFYNDDMCKKLVRLNPGIRWMATSVIYQNYSINRLVLFVVRIFGRWVVGNLNGIKWDDHGGNTRWTLGVREDGR